MNTLRWIAAGWLIFVLAFSLGVYIYAAQVWPYPIIHSIERFVIGAGQELSLLEKLRNDLGLAPERHQHDRDGRKGARGARRGDAADGRNAGGAPDDDRYRMLDGLELDSGRLKPKVHLSEDAPEGYRLIYGVFDFADDYLHGAILLDPDGAVQNVWRISQEVEYPQGDWGIDPQSDATVYPHGFVIARDGSIAAGFDGGSALVKYDYCGDRVWHVKGRFHHSLAFGPDRDAIWAWGKKLGSEGNAGVQFAKIDYRSGELLRNHSVGDIREANRDLSIFDVRQKEVKKGKWKNIGIYHVNDLEPLPRDLAREYPQFEPGDLLFSLRNIHLVFVADPKTFEIKWWRQGLTNFQHDPDWNERGTITIFDNRMEYPPSRIVEIDPQTYEHRVILDGGRYDFFSLARGKHDMLSDGGILVASTRQGRVFEVDADGEVVFDFLNRGTNEDKALAVSEALFLPPDYFEELPKCE